MPDYVISDSRRPLGEPPLSLGCYCAEHTFGLGLLLLGSGGNPALCVSLNCDQSTIVKFRKSVDDTHRNSTSALAPEMKPARSPADITNFGSTIAGRVFVKKNGTTLVEMKLVVFAV